MFSEFINTFEIDKIVSNGKLCYIYLDKFAIRTIVIIIMFSFWIISILLFLSFSLTIGYFML